MQGTCFIELHPVFFLLLNSRSGSVKDSTSPVDPQEAISLLLRELTIFHQVLQLYGVDPALVAQAFRQVMLSFRVSNIERKHPLARHRCFITFAHVHSTIFFCGRRCAIGRRAFRSDIIFRTWSSGSEISISTGKIPTRQ